MSNTTTLVAVMLGAALGSLLAAEESHPSLWFDHPAPTPPPAEAVIIGKAGTNGYASSCFAETLLVGNGRLGALVFGGIDRERLALSEGSLWSGDENPGGGFDAVAMGSFQTLGNLWLDFGGEAKATTYRRSLDLAEAVATTALTRDGVDEMREVIASAPAQVLAIRCTAKRPGAVNVQVRWQDAHAPEVTKPTVTIPLTDFLGQGFRLQVGEQGIRASGALANGLRFATGITVLPTGGQRRSDATGVVITAAEEVVVLVACATDYAMDRSKGWRSGQDPAHVVDERLAAAAKLGWARLRADHIQDHQRLFGRVELDLGPSPADRRALPTDRRKRLAVERGDDPEQEALQFHLGRYLMIAGSRPGGLPLNLQGHWNDVNNPPLKSDYHTNINVQMNYWSAEVTNLSECHLPLFDLVTSQIPAWREATARDVQMWKNPYPKAVPGGWAVRTSHNITGGMGWKWDATANSWYAHHFWEHYAFTQDRVWLRQTAWPVLREVAEFWLCRLTALPDGSLVIPNGWSPEHGPDEAGVAYVQQILWNHLDHTAQAAEILGEDPAFRARVIEARDHLAGPQVGSWGQLREWHDEKGAALYDEKVDFVRDAAKVVTRLRADATKAGSPAAWVWNALPAALRERLVAAPEDRTALVAGLNTLVRGPSLADQEPFRSLPALRPGEIAHRFATAGDPALVPWLNRTLLAEGARLEGGRMDDMPYDHHRHTSHLFAVFPGQQISALGTPALAEAARISLMARSDRGSDVTEWAFAWRTAIAARLRDGEMAHRQLLRFMEYTNKNMLSWLNCFQIDGALGITGSTAEMLLQSHAGAVELLPALPAAWPTGSVHGLRGRGNLTVDIAWQQGHLKSATLTGTPGQSVQVVSQGKTWDLILDARGGATVTVSP